MVWHSSRGRNRGMEDSPRAFDAGHSSGARRAGDAYRNAAAHELNANGLRRPNAPLSAHGVNRSLVLENHHLRRVSVYLVNGLVSRDSDIRFTGDRNDTSRNPTHQSV